MFIIAYGNCQVSVRDHTGAFPKLVRKLEQGEHFGEVGLLNHSVRTATVKSSNYSTMVKIGRETFYEMINKFPDIESALRE
jgi:CRP-like cAMP-binding protein